MASSKEEDYNQRVRRLRRNVRSTLIDSANGLEAVTSRCDYNYSAKVTSKKQKVIGSSEQGTSHREHRASQQGASQQGASHRQEFCVEKAGDVGDSREILLDPPSPVSSQLHIPITDQLNYRLSLAQEPEGIVQLSGKILAIADFKSSELRIDLTNYNAVVKIRGSLYCSCQQSQQIMLGDCPVTATWKSVGSCRHLNILNDDKIARTIDEWFDTEHTYSCHTDNHREVYAVNDWCAVVYDPKTRRFGSAFIHAGNIRCHCTSHHGTCPFITALKAALNGDEQMAILKANLTDNEVISVKERTCVSWKPIAMATTEMSVPSPGVMMELDECQTCGVSRFYEVKSETIICYDVFSSIKIHTHIGKCRDCGAMRQPDGGAMGVLNMGDYAVSHLMMRDYLKLFVSDGLPLHSYHKKIYWSYLEQGMQLSQCISYFQLRMAWIAFAGLLVLENDMCCLCLRSPAIIICDGLALSFRKRYRLAELSPSATTGSTELLDGCSYSKMVFISNKAVRSSFSTFMQKDDLSEEDLSLLSFQARDHCPSLSPALESFLRNKCVPRHWRDLITDLCKSSLLSGLAQTKPEILQELWNEMTEEDVYHDHLTRLSNIFPALLPFMTMSGPNDRGLLDPIIHVILQCLRYVHSRPSHQLSTGGLPEEDTFGSFPSLPLIRQRGAYTMDKKQSLASCKKLAKGHKSLLPGIFLLHCEHGVCYGFHVMDNAESPDVPFTVMLTRFPKAPEIVIYDNACNLHRYAMNRNPCFFKNTKFLVDRFHWNNHTACSSGYSTNTYPALEYLNTQVAEQRNSTLNRLKASLSYQHQDNFFRSLNLFLSFRNTLKMVQIREAKSDAECVLKKLACLYQ